MNYEFMLHRAKELGVLDQFLAIYATPPPPSPTPAPAPTSAPAAHISLQVPAAARVHAAELTPAPPPTPSNEPASVAPPAPTRKAKPRSRKPAAKLAIEPTANHSPSCRLVMPNTFAPTNEQIAINNAATNIVNSGKGVLKLIAYAGTGKTSTLQVLGLNAFSKMRCLYLAFNSDIAKEARERMPSNVTSATIHSIACRTLGIHAGEYKNINTKLIKAIWQNNDFAEEARFLKIKQISQMRWLADGLVNYCKSGDINFSDELVWYTINHDICPLPVTDTPSPALFARRNFIYRLLTRYLPELEKIIKANRKYYSFDYILKSFSLDDNAIIAATSSYNVIMLDEAQDTNNVMRRIIDIASMDKILVAVGDSFQQIYRWNGAVNSLEQIDGHTEYLTQSFRFGHSLADYATDWLESKPSCQLPKPLTGNPNISTELRTLYSKDSKFYEKGDIVICRTNAGVFSAAIKAAKQHLKVFVIKGMDDIFKEFESGIALFEGNLDNVVHSTFNIFPNWAECKNFADEFEDNALSRIIVEIESKNLQKNIDLIRKHLVIDETSADVIFSTAHKVKGREFDNVILFSDFPSIDQLNYRIKKLRDENPPDYKERYEQILEEWNVYYVAITRAIKRLTLTLGANDSKSVLNAILT